MQHQPAERPLHRPPLALGYKPALLRVFGDHLHVDPVRRAGVDDALLVPGICPCQRHVRVVVGHLLDNCPTSDGVVHAGCGHENHQQQAQHVGGDVSFRSFDLLASVDSLGVFGHVA